jgi:ferritin-like metal-binding protein YciE
MSDAARRSARDLLVVGLRDAHAMERHAVVVLEGQLPGLREFPAFRDRVATHVAESRAQAARLAAALADRGAVPSEPNDATAAALGFGEAAETQAAPDAPVKALLADSMFEHLEIAAYRALLEMAELAGAPELRPALETSLREEEAMADWLTGRLPEVTRRFVALRAGVAAPADPRARDERPVLRDLAEFTDAAVDPAEADWPDPEDGRLDRPGST